LSIAGIFPLPSILLHSLFGFIILPLILVLPHEILHLIPYWLTGARDIRIGAELKQYYFYVTAHNHPVTASGFLFIALTPFTVITLILTLLLFLLPPLWQWSMISCLFVHTTMCAGDLAMINFLYLNRGKYLVTWDDTELKEAYFYEKVEE